MHYTFFSIVTFFLACRFSTVKGDNSCGSLKQWLQSAAVSVEIKNRGFHREVETTVELHRDALKKVSVLLLHRWPRGVYVDPYQLSFLTDKVDWQILMDSTIDLEVPAHQSFGFVTYVYTAFTEPLKVTIPIHGRYHQPSFAGGTYEFVTIDPPELLLRTEECSEWNNFDLHTVMEAPCSAYNTSICLWVHVNHQQKHSHDTLQLPIGDGSLVRPVCTVTLLVTIMCCLALSKYMWKYRIV
uniref:phosphatidylinositol-glycan biosynthesis class X protein n=1 Tax=Doryrhamphus excisus TaxID=161450 RepID=UPI0025ADE4DC|nr:phosphatidylinositol-glycan biosynthesis class X protein [Doryrhamphus excisus]